MNDEDDALILQDDVDDGPLPTSAPWRLLVVDDDADLRSATRFSLSGETIDGRPLELLEAASAAEAQHVLDHEPDIAVMLLDVVMETPDAGLRLVERVRARPEWAALRIVLRTGQPGYAPELEVIRAYDINDYKTKTDLTKVRLLTTLTVALRGYQQLRRLEAHQRGLEKVVQASGKLMSERSSFSSFAEGVLTQICTLVEGQPEGVLLLRRAPGQDDGGEVIAAAGAFSSLSGNSERQLPAAMRDALKQLAQARVISAGAYGLVCASAADGERLLLLFSLGSPLDDIALQQLELFAFNLALAYDDLKAYLQLQYQAHFDSETGLRNRGGLAHVLQDQGAMAVAQLHVGQLQEIRGVLGEAVARRALRHLAERVRTTVHGSGWASRLEGDRLAVALQPAQLAAVEPALLSTLAQPLSVAGLQLHLPVALGWTQSSDSAGFEQALDEAGLVAALLPSGHQIRSGRFAPSLRDAVHERMRLVAELPRALEQNRIEMHLQPQVLLADRSVIGVEALMRLRMADGSMVSPDRFIPLAEQTGLIVPLGQRMLELALRWLQANTQGRLSINVSPRQLEEGDFAAHVVASVRQTGLAPARLRLEITESGFANDTELVSTGLAHLTEAGFELSIDDFGTGHSSLGRLAEIPVHELKLDRSLVRGLEDDERARRVARLIVELGNDLGVEVLAEGIETEGQCAMLRELGCVLGQGWLFGRPQPAFATAR